MDGRLLFSTKDLTSILTLEIDRGLDDWPLHGSPRFRVR